MKFIWLFFLLATVNSLYAATSAPDTGYMNRDLCEKVIMHIHKPDREALQKCLAYLEVDEQDRDAWLVEIARGRLSYLESDYITALKHFEAAELYLSRMKPGDQRKLYLFYSVVLIETGQTEKAGKILKNALDGCIKDKDSICLENLYCNLGYAYSINSQLDSGVYYFGHALEVAQNINDIYMVAVINLDFGTMYFNLGLNEKAMSSYKKALDITRRKYKNIDGGQFKNIEITLLSNIGALLFVEKKYDSSIVQLQTLQKILKDPETNKVKDCLKNYAYSLLILGDNNSQLGHLDKALNYYKEGKAYFKSMGNKAGLFAIYMSLNSFYLAKHDYKKSIAYGDSIIQLHRETGLKNSLGQVYTNIAQAYEAAGNYKEANRYRQYRTDFDAKAYELGKVASLEAVNMSSGMKEKEQELMSVKSRVELLTTKQKVLLTGLVLLIILGTIGFYAYRKSRLSNKQLAFTNEQKQEFIKEQEQLLEEQRSRLKELKEQPEKNLPLALPNGNIVQPEDILYAKSEDHYLVLKLKDGTKQIFRHSLSKFQKELSGTSFFRIHNSYVVNLKRIKSVRAREVILADDQTIKVGPTYWKRFKEVLNV